MSVNGIVRPGSASGTGHVQDVEPIPPTPIICHDAAVRRREGGYWSRIARIGIVSAAVLVVVGCGSDVGGEVSYQAPIVPIRISIDTDGRVSFGFGGSLVTPIATFSVAASVSTSLVPEERTLLLVIRHLQDGVVVDDAFRVKAEEVVVTLDGHTTVAVTNQRVFIDASDGVGHMVEIRDPRDPPTVAPSQTTETRATAGPPAPDPTGTHEAPYGSISLPLAKWTVVGNSQVRPGGSPASFVVTFDDYYWGGVRYDDAPGCNYVLRGEGRILDGDFEHGYGFAVRTSFNQGEPLGLAIQYDPGVGGYKDVEYPNDANRGTVTEAETDGNFHRIAIGVVGDSYVQHIDGVRVGSGITSIGCGGLYLKVWRGTVEFRNLTVERIDALSSV
jgi:hypothetical protein